MSKLETVLKIAHEEKLCAQWECKTCGARDFIKLTESLLNLDNLFSINSIVAILNELKLLNEIFYYDGTVFLIRLCASRTKHDLIVNTLNGNLSGELYDRMLERKLQKDKARAEHYARNDPEFVRADRAAKKEARAVAHTERLRLKAIRDLERGK